MTQTVNIAYVGKKESEDAFKDKTGLIWFPGAVHPIAATVAAQMLKHPDVFALADAAPVQVASLEPTAGNVDATNNGAGRPTLRQVEHAMSLLAAVGLAVIDPTTPQAESLNGVALPPSFRAPTGPGEGTAGTAESFGFGAGDATAGQNAAAGPDKVTETSTSTTTSTEGITLGAGTVVGSGDASGGSAPAAEAKPAAKKASAKTAAK